MNMNNPFYSALFRFLIPAHEQGFGISLNFIILISGTLILLLLLLVLE